MGKVNEQTWCVGTEKFVRESSFSLWIYLRILSWVLNGNDIISFLSCVFFFYPLFAVLTSACRVPHSPSMCDLFTNSFSCNKVIYVKQTDGKYERGKY